MRLKKVKGADEYVASSPLVVQNPTTYFGKWKEFLKNDKIHVEIGCGKGDFLIGMAKKYPTISFLGIEKYTSVLIKALQKVESEKISNIHFINMDANQIDTVFNREVEKLYLNFSDPWPKTKHHKRRLTSPNFLNLYENIFTEDLRIQIKTDNPDLFSYSLYTTSQNDYKIEEISFNLHETSLENIETEYEKRFSKLGYPIYYVSLRKSRHLFDKKK